MTSGELNSTIGYSTFDPVDFLSVYMKHKMDQNQIVTVTMSPQLVVFSFHPFFFKRKHSTNFYDRICPDYFEHFEKRLDCFSTGWYSMIYRFKPRFNWIDAKLLILGIPRCDSDTFPDSSTHNETEDEDSDRCLLKSCSNLTKQNAENKTSKKVPKG